MRRPTSLSLLLCLATLLPLASCNAVGPTAVRGARIPYNEAVATSRDQQLLLNLVRLKYRDVPLFLDVGSVSTQYQMSYGASAASRFVFDDALNDHGLNAGGSVGYSEKPTVTYTPLSGEKFVTQMMSPIPLETVFLMAQSGWSMGRVLRCCAQSLNDVRNAPSASGPTPSYEPEHEQFARLSAHARQLQLAGGISLKRIAAKTVALTVAPDAAPEDAQALQQLLGLQSGATSFPLTARMGAGDGSDVGVQTRSFLGVMFYLSHAIEAPAEHVAAGKVTVTRDAEGAVFDWNSMTGDLLRVRSTDKRPGDAYVSVKYRNAWFFIDDADLNSKSTFSLLSYLFSLQSGDRKALAPALTLPL